MNGRELLREEEVNWPEHLSQLSHLYAETMHVVTFWNGKNLINVGSN